MLLSLLVAGLYVSLHLGYLRLGSLVTKLAIIFVSKIEVKKKLKRHRVDSVSL